MVEATAPSPVETQPTHSVPSTEPKYGYWWGTGRRKSAVARVRIREGKGEFVINGRQIEAYFTEIEHRNDVVAPLEVTKMRNKMDVFVNVSGGGPTGQAGAILLGVARALKKYDLGNDDVLRQNGHLTVDARRVERKKYGQRGARRRFQFSKR